MIIKTVGSLAEHNSSGMSEDAKESQWRKDHDYLFNRKLKELPAGMKRIGEPGNRVASKKQNKTDKRKINKRKK